MGIKGFYGYCTREIKDCHRTVNIVEEISKFQAEKKKNPLIIINLSTLSYHFKLNNKDLLCGYQLNKIKFKLENFLSQLQSAGAELEFVFKKTLSDDQEFLRRRLRDYQAGCEIIETIAHFNDFEKLTKLFTHQDKFPYNTLILVALIQSAEKFGPVHGCNMIKGKPTVQQVELAREKDAAYIMGLDTYYFILPSYNWKIWCDAKINMTDMTIQELDPKLVMAHFELEPSHSPLFATLIGDLQSSSNVCRKVIQHFGTKLFPTAAKFLHKLRATSTDDKIEEIVEKIFGKAVDPHIIEDFKYTVKTFEIDNESETHVNMSHLELVKNDFMSIAEEILINTPIFINPSFLDLRSTDMKTINELVLPLIQKTAGILLKNAEDDYEPRSLVLLVSHDGDFIHCPIEAIYPEFDVPPLDVVLSGSLSNMEKMAMLFWLTDMDVEDYELITIPEEYVADCIILLYLMKNKSLKFIDARCILKTLVDAYRREVPLEYSTDYPEKVNERAFRCSFLYSKMYFLLHSCLSSLGMKNLCPDIQFDGVYFQKIYALNILADKEAEKEDADSDGVDATGSEEDVYEGEFNHVAIIDEFENLIRNGASC